MSPAGRPTATTPERWVQGALDEIERAGVGALAVESVARRLGVSKGGFYHHFKDRRSLLRAALELWQERFVIELARRFEAIGDPRERLTALLVHAAVELEPTVILRLMAASEDPDVAAALQRAADGRLALLRGAFRELGLGPEAAANRAILFYSAYLGLAELRSHAPSALPDEARVRSYLQEIEAVVLRDL